MNFEEFVLKSLGASPLTKHFFNARWVTAVEVSVLKCFSRFKVCTHIENPFFLESLSLIDCGV